MKPLTQFLVPHHIETRGTGFAVSYSYYWLHPTKRWRGNTVSDSEADEYKRRGVTVRDKFPPGRAFDAARKRHKIAA